MTEPIKLPPLPEKSYLGDDASYGYESWDMEEYARAAIEAYQAGRSALQSQPRTEPSEWLKQHEALMHRVSKAAMVVGYGGTINGATAEQSLEHAENTLLDHARSLQSRDREDAELVEILREAAEIIAAVPTDYAPENLRGPIVDELEGFALMLDHARRIEGDGE